jgi:hypothetical protein
VTAAKSHSVMFLTAVDETGSGGTLSGSGSLRFFGATAAPMIADTLFPVKIIHRIGA